MGVEYTWEMDNEEGRYAARLLDKNSQAKVILQVYQGDEKILEVDHLMQIYSWLSPDECWRMLEHAHGLDEEIRVAFLKHREHFYDVTDREFERDPEVTWFAFGKDRECARDGTGRLRSLFY